MRMNEKERAIIECLVQSSSPEISLDQICHYLYVIKKMVAPENYRQAMASTLRNLEMKLAKNGCRLTRISPLGTGHLAVYKFRGNFSKFLETKTPSAMAGGLSRGRVES